jgi:SAM-dependent methyltransferase
MPTKESKPNYMFDNTQELEAERLHICNITHNPYSLKFLKPFIDGLPQRSQVMEIGCGGGELASEVVKLLPQESTLHLVDRSEDQLLRTNNLFNSIRHEASISIKTHQLDLVQDAESLKLLGQMDLIYCRWVICHIPDADRLDAISTILWALKPGGVFILEDGDNTSVQYVTKDRSKLPVYAEEAYKRFRETSDQIRSFAKIDIQYSGKKQQRDIREAEEKAELSGGEVMPLGQYRLTLHDKSHKRLLSTPWRTAINMIFHAKDIRNPTKEMAEEFVRPADDCDNDDNIQAEFLTQSATAYRRPLKARL